MSKDREDSSSITVVNGARVRHWMSGNHSPYPGMLHDIETDKVIDWRDAISSKLRELPEGAITSVVIIYAEPSESEIDPKDIWILYKPHHYGHVDKIKRLAE